MARKSNQEEIFDVFAEGIRKRTNKTVRQMANTLKKEVEKNVSIDDEHTPKELKRLGHPYKTENLHDAPLVHRVSHNLSDNIEIFKTNRKDELLVGVDPEKVPYVEAVLFGSEKMISRDFLSYSLLNINKKLRKIIKKGMKSKKKGR